MRIKNLILTSTLALSLMGSTLASAAQTTTAATSPMTKISQSATKTNQAMWKAKHYHQRAGKLLTVPQRAELHTIKQAMWTEMRPLLKEKQALRFQLMGKIATPNVQWSEVAVVLHKVNENNAKITTLLAKTQVTSFQKLGVALPFHTKHRAYSHHQYC